MGPGEPSAGALPRSAALVPAGRGGVPRGVAWVLLAALSAACAVVVWRWATAGHLSTDSIQQMFEALTGRSVSWNPPFMSAFLGVLGGDQSGEAERASGRFVMLMTGLLWGAFGLAAATSMRRRVSLPALLAVLVLLANPVLLVYAGIVWKDVFAAALLLLSTVLGVVALGSPNATLRLVLSLLAMAVLGLLPHVRQQGVFLAPWFALLPLMALAWAPGWRRRSRAGAIVAAIALALLANAATAHWAEQRIVGNDGLDMSFGFTAIYGFDIAGIEAYTPDGPLVEAGAPSEVLAEIDRHYTPERIDFLDRTPALGAFLNRYRGDELRALWFEGVKRHPQAYLTHRRFVFERLLGIGGVMGCVPVHLGVSGIPGQLTALGLTEEIDSSDRELYASLKPLFYTPVFGHWFYLAGLLVMALFIAWRRRGRTRLVLLAIVAGALLFYGSFVPTGIACDFRYLFPAIPIVTLLAVLLLLGWREASDQAQDVPVVRGAGSPSPTRDGQP